MFVIGIFNTRQKNAPGYQPYPKRVPPYEKKFKIVTWKPEGSDQFAKDCKIEIWGSAILKSRK